MKRKRRRSRPDHREGDGGDEHAKEATAAPADICDDVLLSIFSRLSTRDAFRCAASLSKRHRQLIAGADFWLLHRRLSPPPFRPSMAYMVTVVEPKPPSDRPPAPLLDLALPRCAFRDFHHLTGGGNDGGSLRYSLVDRVHLRHKYAGTCNGVILLAPKTFNGGAPIVLFNPAAAGSEVEARMELPDLPAKSGRYRVAGFGYGASSGVYRVLVTREERVVSPNETVKSYAAYRARELLAYTLDGGGAPSADQQRLRSVLPEVDAKKIGGKPLFLDGKVYLLADHSRVLAFDADDETVAAIELPGERPPGNQHQRHARSNLIEVSGRLCVATGAGALGDDLALWLLAAGRGEWVRLCELRWCGAISSKLAGAWDVGGVVLLHLVHRQSKTGYLHMYDTRNDEAYRRLNFPRMVAKQGGGSGRVMCWGYRPTLVSPGSIVGAPPLGRRGAGGALAALDPMLERDVAAGRERTLEAVCFMNLLLYIMSKLPDNPLDVVNEIKGKSLPFSLR
ncbi:unnamed protein product [Urochloa decumbens]|uniref:F-box domain-containing protein n=1 Tax=Urochloa decumbens TaxID=240449 RepID=A0ABC9F678_9POAL